MYTPKNKIKTGLVAGPNEFVDSNGNSYTGPYYKLASGIIQSGEYPGKGENKYLFPVGPLTPNPDDVPYVPPSLTTTPIPPLFPTPKDYEQGIFIRYFSKKRNEYLFNELTKDEYTTLNNTANQDYNIYKPFNIKWMLTGSVQTVSDYNRYTIKNAEEQEKVYGLDEYLKMNYTQYYKAPIQDNLYTNGKEFKTPNGGEYIGSYHIHPDKGPMVGATHSIESHSILIPINSTLQSSTGSQMTPNNMQPTNYSSGRSGGSSGGGSY